MTSHEALLHALTFELSGEKAEAVAWTLAETERLRAALVKSDVGGNELLGRFSRVAEDLTLCHCYATGIRTEFTEAPNLSPAVEAVRRMRDKLAVLAEACSQAAHDFEAIFGAENATVKRLRSALAVGKETNDG